MFAPKRREQLPKFQCGFEKFTSHLRHIQDARIGNSSIFNNLWRTGL